MGPLGKTQMMNKTTSFLLGMAGVLTCLFYIATPISARLQSEPTLTFVEIGGEDYGHFDNIAELEDLVGQVSDSGYTTVSLRRDFVTERSLYNWAATNNRFRHGPEDVHLIKKTADGQIVRRYVLRLSHPLSWSFEQDAA